MKVYPFRKILNVIKNSALIYLSVPHQSAPMGPLLCETEEKPGPLPNLIQPDAFSFQRWLLWRVARGASEGQGRSFHSRARLIWLWYSGLRFRSRRQTGGLVSSVSHTLRCNSWQRVSRAACRSGLGVAKIGKDTSQRRRIINHMRKGETKSNTGQLLHLLTHSGRSLP